MVDHYIANLKLLHAIAFDAGDKDAAIAATVGTLDGILNEYQVPHTFEIYEGVHTSRIAERMETKRDQNASVLFQYPSVRERQTPEPLSELSELR
jgi:hypothetical protein